MGLAYGKYRICFRTFGEVSIQWAACQGVASPPNPPTTPRRRRECQEWRLSRQERVGEEELQKQGLQTESVCPEPFKEEGREMSLQKREL